MLKQSDLFGVKLINFAETIDRPEDPFPPSGPGGKGDEGFFRLEQQTKLIKLYPNPAHDFITLQYNNAGQYQNLAYSLNNQSGKMMLNREFNTKEREVLIDLTGLKAGVYTLVIYGDNNIIETHKITIIN
jgi:hypothetical protein